jgi:transcriptional regulator with XRE-family HTH domain
MSTNSLKFLEKLTGGPLTFSKMLKAIRLSDEVSQVELANNIGVSRGLICDIEKGRRFPTFEQANNIANYLGYSPQGFIAILIQDQLREVNLPMKVTLEKAS